MGLYDMMMIKDNHIAAAGGIRWGGGVLGGVGGLLFAASLFSDHPAALTFVMQYLLLQTDRQALARAETYIAAEGLQGKLQVGWPAGWPVEISRF
jgi:hypothetical protein